MNIIQINTIIYIIFWIIFYHKIRRFNFFMVVWTSYTIGALMSYVALETGFYYEATKEQVLRTATFEPFFFVFLFYIIAIIPFWKVDERKIDLVGVNVNNKIYKTFANANLFLYSIVSVFKTYEMIVMQAFISYAEQYEISKGGEGESLGALLYPNPILEHFSALGGTYCSMMAPLMMLYYLAKIAQTRKINFKISYAIVVTLIPVIAVGVVGASRGAIFFAMFQVSFYYLLIRRYISRGAKRKVFGAGLIALALVVGVSISITESREEAGKQRDTVSSIVNYFGQPTLNASYVYYGKVKSHPMGARLFDKREGDKSKALPFQVYWSNVTGVPTHYFKSFYGDLYIEFGTFAALVFLLLYVSLWNRVVLTNYYKPIYLPFLWIYFHMLIYANFDFEKLTFLRNVWFPFLILFCVLLSRLLKKHKMKQLNTALK